jgi:hypothetical protein
MYRGRKKAWGVVTVGVLAGATMVVGVKADAAVIPHAMVDVWYVPPEPWVVPEVWEDLAECESHGEWGYGPGSGWGSGIHHGGLQFLPSTWASFKDEEHPEFAWMASPREQVEVAEKVLAVQGWQSWPTCSKMLGYR